MTKEMEEHLISEYMKNEKSLHVIAEETGVKYNTILALLRRRRAKGVIKKTDRCKEAKNKRPPRKHGYTLQRKKPKVENVENINPTLDEGQSVKCTGKIARTCIYGHVTDSCGWCNYMDVTGHARILVSPDPEHCTVYVKKEKRRKAENDERMSE